MDLEVASYKSDNRQLTYYENKFLVSRSDLKEEADFDRLKALKSVILVGMFDEPFVVINRSAFVKLIDGEKFKDELVDDSYKSLEPRGLEDDYFQVKLTNAFKIMCSKALESLDGKQVGVTWDFDSLTSLNRFEREILKSNIKFLPQKLKTLAVGDIFW